MEYGASAHSTGFQSTTVGFEILYDICLKLLGKCGDQKALTIHITEIIISTPRIGNAHPVFPPTLALFFPTAFCVDFPAAFPAALPVTLRTVFPEAFIAEDFPETRFDEAGELDFLAIIPPEIS
jgi:hypothetical protein